jgi:choline dehydrogenase
MQGLFEGQDAPIVMIRWDSGNNGVDLFIKPSGRGTVTINSTDPLVNPIVDYLTMIDLIDFDIVLASYLKTGRSCRPQVGKCWE